MKNAFLALAFVFGFASFAHAETSKQVKARCLESARHAASEKIGKSAVLSANTIRFYAGPIGNGMNSGLDPDTRVADYVFAYSEGDRQSVVGVLILQHKCESLVETTSSDLDSLDRQREYDSRPAGM